MTFLFRHLCAAAMATCLFGPAHAASVALTFTDQGSLANGTRVFAASLTGLGLTEIASLTIVDDGTTVGGAPGIFSGFDLDGILLDGDGNLATTGDQVSASSYLFSAGTTRPTSSTVQQPTAAHPGPTFGSLDATTIDFATATLDVIGDGANFADVNLADGFLTLGDGGSLTAIFGPAVTVGASLFLAIGEQGGQAGEFASASVFVSDTVPEVPLPASAWLLVAALGGLGAVRRRRRS